MPSHHIHIKDIAKSHNKTIAVCKALVDQYKAEPETEIVIDFSDCDFIYPDYAILLLFLLNILNIWALWLKELLN